MSGLDSLDAMRKRKSSRAVPPPRNAPRATPVQAPGAVATPGEPPAPGAAEAAPAPVPVPAERVEAAATPGELSKVSIYLDGEADAFLEDVRTAGRRSRPKVDASRSAVVRFALARLAAEMAPEQVATELQRQAGPYLGTGRRRL